MKTLLDEVERIKSQQHQSKSQICGLLSHIFHKFKKQSFNKFVISADYVYISDDTEKYRPDNGLYVLLETETRYIQFSIKMTCAHSEINTRIWITQDKNIDTNVIDFEYGLGNSGFIEVYNQKVEKTKYGLSNFERYMIKLITDCELQDFGLNPLSGRSRLDDEPCQDSENDINSQTDSENEHPDPDMEKLNSIGALLD